MKTSWVVIASGPSLTQEDVDAVRGMNVIAINDNYQKAPWASVLYACDPHWWEWHSERLSGFQGEKWTQTESWTEEQKQRISAKHDLRWIKSVGEPALSTDKRVIHQGDNSGIQAINLAYHWGAKTIVLLGFDMQPTGGRNHWFGDHPNKVSPTYHYLIPRFESVAKQAPGIGLEIINATRETALRCFQRMDIGKAIDYCLYRDRAIADSKANRNCA